MDLALYSRVLWRFRWIVFSGLTLAIILPVLSVARVTSDGLSYRKHEVWQSSSTLMLTEGGAPFADPSRFSELTDLYSELANSDEVKTYMRRAGADKTWKLSAAPVRPTFDPSAVLPVITLSGEAFTRSDAVKATILGRQAFLQYIGRQRGSAGILVLQGTTPPTLIEPRKKTLPIVVFLAMLSATVALAFVLENLRPRPSPDEIIRLSAGIINPPAGTRSSA